MRLAVGSDTACHLTDEIIVTLEAQQIDVVRCGALAGKEADYVDSAWEVAEKVGTGQCEQGLAFCYTGTGASIIAIKFPGVRAALCIDSYAAQIARLANNANVLVLSIRLTGEPLAKEILATWLTTLPSTEPRRVNFHCKTDEIEQRVFRPSASSVPALLFEDWNRRSSLMRASAVVNCQSTVTRRSLRRVTQAATACSKTRARHVPAL